ncbi:MAG: hypothetical protein H6822_24610 [Planctomycetaceae bacterium]|nr:hypothetical protein [Planctomycetales bacterium]MCB9925384.1 hypothetical protein [Planctomycetaceae bacterium]
MNEAYLTDDVSLRKNDFFIHLTRDLRVYWVVCAEFRIDKKSKIDVQKDDPPNSWRSMAAYPYLKHLDLSRHLTDESLWRDQLPGITGINCAEFPKPKEDRIEYLETVTTDANRLDADIVFWDLSTGIATDKKNEAAKSKRNADPCYIYWDELRWVVKATNGITCVYQHKPQYGSWESVWTIYETALGRSIRFRDGQPLFTKITRAKALFIPRPDQTDKLQELNEIVDAYTPGANSHAGKDDAVVGTPTMDGNQK